MSEKVEGKYLPAVKRIWSIVDDGEKMNINVEKKRKKF